MKDKNKGFTIMELIVVVAILGVLGVIASVSLTHTLRDSEQKKCDEFVREVEDAACVYSGLSYKEVICERGNCAPIKLEILVNAGLVSSEIDACTGEMINLENTVSVNWDAEGEKKCTYNGVKIYEK